MLVLFDASAPVAIETRSGVAVEVLPCDPLADTAFNGASVVPSFRTDELALAVPDLCPTSLLRTLVRKWRFSSPFSTPTP